MKLLARFAREWFYNIRDDFRGRAVCDGGSPVPRRINSPNDVGIERVCRRQRRHNPITGPLCNRLLTSSAVPATSPRRRTMPSSSTPKAGGDKRPTGGFLVALQDPAGQRLR
jgi:hypothetical protein